MRPEESDLAILCYRLSESLPGVVAGWNLRLAAGPPEEEPVLIDAFNVPEEQERQFFRSVIPLVRDTEERIGKSILVVTHSPEASTTLYSQSVQLLRSRQYVLTETKCLCLKGCLLAA